MTNEKFDLYCKEYFSSLRNNKLTEAMAYAFEGGKHFRPELIFAVVKGFNLDEEDAYPAALALEMVHSYSLIHDDLPCMDDADLRRGKPSVHKAYGEDIAVLAGDGLLTHAFGVLADADYRDHIRLSMISDLSSLAGLNGMLHGQYLDLTHSNKEEVDNDILNEIQDYKTGALFETALFFAMYLTGDEDHIAFYEGLAIKMGRVFQLQDDLFDQERSENETGKSTTDVANEKASSLCVYNSEELKAQIDKLFAEIDDDLEHAPFIASYFKELIQQMKER